MLVKTEEESDVKNEEGSYSGVSVKEEVEEKEEEVAREEKKEEEPEQPPYFKYSYMIPESTCTTSIAQNGPITLFVARNKRPVKRAPLLECRSPPTTRSRAGGKPVDNTEAEELKCLSEGFVLLYFYVRFNCQFLWISGLRGLILLFVIVIICNNLVYSGDIF